MRRSPRDVSPLSPLRYRLWPPAPGNADKPAPQENTVSASWHCVQRVAAESPLRFRRDTEHEVEARSEFAGFRTWERRKIDGHGRARLFISDAAPDAIALIARISLDVALGGEQVLAL